MLGGWVNARKGANNKEKRKLFINHSNGNREIMERSFGYKPENVNVKCRNCSETIFNGGELKFRYMRFLFQIIQSKLNL
jgi:hypothetical protein